MDRELLEKYAKNQYVQIGFLAALLALYIITKLSFFGILFAIALIGIVAYEIWSGGKSRGWKEELKDTLVSLAWILVFWLALGFVLNSPVPINAVVSCSMLPNVERGDLIIVQGEEPIGYEAEISPDELSALQSTSVSVHAGSAGQFELNGSLYSYCTQHKDSICSLFAANPELFTEKRGPFTFNYGECMRVSEQAALSTPCVKSVEFRGKTYYTNLSHDTVVYGPPSGDLYSYTGDIIHRLFFRVECEGETYYLTKGDNNPVFDIQAYEYSHMLGNRAPASANYKGRIFFRIPFLGYPKLFISGFFSETVNCDSTLEYHTVS
ncbi:MAG: hypothetical protein ACLFUZ_03880 [Candidatus Micrarchaeia archaeon]